jgi:hypothetical protein
MPHIYNSILVGLGNIFMEIKMQLIQLDKDNSGLIV